MSLTDRIEEGPFLPSALEALPELLGKHDLKVLKLALLTCPANEATPFRLEAESEGDFLARLIRCAAGLRFERAA